MIVPCSPQSFRSFIHFSRFSKEECLVMSYIKRAPIAPLKKIIFYWNFKATSYLYKTIKKNDKSNLSKAVKTFHNPLCYFQYNAIINLFRVKKKKEA